MALFDIIVFGIATGLILFLLYSLISSLLILSAIRKISGNELKKLLTVLLFTIFSGFIYGIWYFLQQVGIINIGNGTFLKYSNNILLFLFFAMLIYLSFLARDLGKRFGFKEAGRDITKRLKSK